MSCGLNVSHDKIFYRNFLARERVYVVIDIEDITFKTFTILQKIDYINYYIVTCVKTHYTEIVDFYFGIYLIVLTCPVD